MLKLLVAAAPRRLAGGEDHDPGRQRLLPLAADALVRLATAIGYVLGLAKNPALERPARDWIERAERQFRRTGQPQRLFGSFAYAAGTLGPAAGG